MNDLASEITIAVTVYDRREYLASAIRSSLSQRGTSSQSIIVVEDCAPDLGLRESVISEFGDRITYHRNKQRRGLFDNWNACIEACTTDWLCILHDDDFLEPTFIESMIELQEAAPGRGLYYGECQVVDRDGNRVGTKDQPLTFRWNELDLKAWTHYDPVCFPGQLFNVAAARALGGFRPKSQYCADWEMWFKLALRYGAVTTNRIVANYREHHSVGRGTTSVDLSGRKYGLVNAHRKKHMSWLRELRPGVRFDRVALQAEAPMPTRFILDHGYGFSPRMLRYNAGLLDRSTPPHVGYRCFQLLARVLTWRSLRMISRIFRLVSKQ